jgi:hypothetical protein
VNITSPADGATVSGTISFEATASDTSGIQKLQFWVDSTYIGYDSKAPYSKTINASALANGVHTLRVRAIDMAGNMSTVTIEVSTPTADSTPPILTITEPNQAAVVSGAIIFAATATDAGGMQKVQFWLDSTYLGYDGSAPYAKSIETAALTNGYHTLRARAVDRADNMTTAKITIVVINTDITAPVVSIDAPASAAEVSGTALSIDASATDNKGVQKLQFWIDGTYLGYDGTPPYAKTVDTTTLSNGNHVIKVRAVDWAGNTATTSLTVSVNN